MEKKLNLLRLVLCGWICLFASCTQVAITGRKQLNLVPTSLINSLSLQEYKSFMSEHEVSSNAEQRQMVERVGRKISEAVEQYCTQNYMSEILNGYSWEFNLIEDPAVNAWALPGGKVVVYTGLMEVARDDAGLAVVMGHEIAHNIAKHGNERMSHALLVEFGGMALSEAMSKSPVRTRNLFAQSYSIGTQYGLLLPYSRIQETEADRIGLIFMAIADYNPNEAIGFWQRMAASKEDGPAPPELLSTHPANETRIENIKGFMPEAMSYYQKEGSQPQYY